MLVEIAGVTFDGKQRTLGKAGQYRHLEPKVFTLLTTLVEANGSIVTRDELIKQVWQNRVVGESAINRTVSLLRTHFANFTDRNIIETVPTQGYRLVEKVITLAPPVEDERSPQSNLSEGLVQENTFQQYNNKPSSIETVVTQQKSTKTLIWLIGLALVIGCLVFVNADKFATVAQPSSLRLVSNPLIGLKGWEHRPSASDSGELILFHHQQNDHTQAVYLYDTQSHKKQKILENAQASLHANGEQIVYVQQLKNECSINLYNVSTQQSQLLFLCDEAPSALVWGEENTFYFNKRFSKAHPYQVFSYNIATSRLTQVTNPSSESNNKGDFQFSFNLQRNQLAILRYIDENNTDVVIMHSGVILSENRINHPIKQLVWRPDSNVLVLADNTTVYQYNIAARTLQLLKQLEINISSLATISNNDKHFLLVGNVDFTSEIIKTEFKTLQDSIWQQSARVELLPRISADTHLLLSTRYQTHHLWQVEQGEANLVDVALPFDLQFTRFEISPDGQFVLFSKQGALYEIDLQTKKLSLVFKEQQQSYVANYANDDAIIYSSNQSGQWQLWQYQRATGQHHQLTANGGYSGRMSGQYLYYSKFTSDGLYRKKLADGEEELVIVDFNRINWLNWQLIDDVIYFYRPNSGIWQYNTTTKLETLVMPQPNNFINQFAVAPHQQYILWVRHKDIEGDIYQYVF